MSELDMESFLQDAFVALDEVRNQSDLFMLGILLGDARIQHYLKMLTHMHAIVMQSLQVNNLNRALRYLVAIGKMRNNNVAQVSLLRKAITAKLYEPLWAK